MTPPFKIQNNRHPEQSEGTELTELLKTNKNET
jgi:hypothetical protein